MRFAYRPLSFVLLAFCLSLKPPGEETSLHTRPALPSFPVQAGNPCLFAFILQPRPRRNNVDTNSTCVHPPLLVILSNAKDPSYCLYRLLLSAFPPPPSPPHHPIPPALTARIHCYFLLPILFIFPAPLPPFPPILSINRQNHTLSRPNP